MDSSEPSVKRRKLSHDEAGPTETNTSTSPIDARKSDASEQAVNSANGTAVVDTFTTGPTNAASEIASAPQSLSKNQLKKLRKKQEWEAGREFRKAKRKEKIQERKAKQREKRQEELEERKANGLPREPNPNASHRRPTRLPITFLIDCGFDDKMQDKERISLGSQLTRSYSDNSKAPYQTHLYVSSWNGHLRERFDTVLNEQHKNWKGVEFLSDDFVDTAKEAGKAMKKSKGDRFAGFFAKYRQQTQDEHEDGVAEPVKSTEIDQKSEQINNTGVSQMASIADLQEQGEVIYLTSDSPHTLNELTPYSTYIIGGLVDKNRHKGICYKRACDRNIKTAKLPIGQYMEMQSRFVLATNHVVEIMLRYLEYGDWGEAFMKVIPKRKGGKLKNGDQNDTIPNQKDKDDNHESGTDGDLGSEEDPTVGDVPETVKDQETLS